MDRSVQIALVFVMTANAQQTMDVRNAIVVLISEEKSKISVAEDGRFSHIGMDKIALQKYLDDRMFISSGD